MSAVSRVSRGLELRTATNLPPTGQGDAKETNVEHDPLAFAQQWVFYQRRSERQRRLQPNAIAARHAIAEWHASQHARPFSCFGRSRKLRRARCEVTGSNLHGVAQPSRVSLQATLLGC